MTAPMILSLAEGPAARFCAATTRMRSVCKTPLRADGTCPKVLHHHPRPMTEAYPRRMDVPPVIIQLPLCPMCDCEVGCDGDSFWCENCALNWSTSGGEPGRVSHEDQRQCEATAEKHGDTYRCVLDEDHELRFGGSKIAIRTRHYSVREGDFVTTETRPHLGIRVEANGYPDELGYFYEDTHRWGDSSPRTSVA